MKSREEFNPQDSRLETEAHFFPYYSRPLVSRLLESMELNKSFHSGQGDYLFYEKNGLTIRVLDFTGGYGANFLGHRNPRLLKKLRDWSEHGAPSHTQASIRSESGLLAKRISDTLSLETSEGPWISTFSNSGTEAIEAAIKHSLMAHQHRLIDLNQEVDREINLSLLYLKRQSDEKRSELLQILRLGLQEKISHLRMPEERRSYLLHQIASVHDVHELVQLVREVNLSQLKTKPSFFALEKSFHGKTMGSLALTYNEGFRESFYLGAEYNKHTHFLSPYTDAQELQRIVDEYHLDLLVLSLKEEGPVWAKQSFSQIAAAFVEPIQGEAGILPVSASFIALLKKHSLQERFLLVFDEIQTGVYRTGSFSAGKQTHITPDIFTFSKSLGGGIAKIAATSVLQKNYVEEFGFLHTSTFSDDGFSASIALEVLDILQGENSPLPEAMRTADYLWARLEWLKNLYPEIIKEVRGKGLMLALEFHDVLQKMGFEFKTICESGMQGYLFASALLNQENVRLSPSLSNNLTLRIQPSCYAGIFQVEELMRALVKLCEALHSKDIVYFLSSIYPEQKILPVRSPDVETGLKLGERPLCVFLCHLIDEFHIKKISKSLTEVANPLLLKKLALSKDIAEFSVYHTQTLTNEEGKEMDLILLGIPVTSEELKKTFVSKDRYKIVKKVQDALGLAKSLGANTVGLGQFTSIVSGNGLFLDPLGMNLTTGNAYTVSLMVQAALRSAREKKMELEECTAALIGAAGNIMSVATSITADYVKKIILIHHSPIEASPKLQEAVRRILLEITESDAKTKLVHTLKSLWKDQDLIDFLNRPEVQEIFVVSSDLSLIQEAEIVLCGASASNSFLKPEMFKQNSVVVDVAVPPSVSTKIMREQRPDVSYHLGGVAKIPHNQSINAFIFPLGLNECFACMAETFALSFTGKSGYLNIGDLNKKMVLEVQAAAEKSGFILGSYKKRSSL